MEYRGYTARIEFDESIDAFHGRVIDVNDVVTFEGTSVEELRREFESSVDDYLEWCASEGVEPDRPYSGRFLLRLDPAVHRAASVQAARAGTSLNDWVSTAITDRLQDGPAAATNPLATTA